MCRPFIRQLATLNVGQSQFVSGESQTQTVGRLMGEVLTGLAGGLESVMGLGEFMFIV